MLLPGAGDEELIGLRVTEETHEAWRSAVVTRVQHIVELTTPIRVALRRQ